MNRTGQASKSWDEIGVARVRGVGESWEGEGGYEAVKKGDRWYNKSGEQFRLAREEQSNGVYVSLKFFPFIARARFSESIACNLALSNEKNTQQPPSGIDNGITKDRTNGTVG
ncbi:hypothetical protein RRG08_060066 [Elysia crispata]|uniref:Uncharacterized protein n=1 Tax=Elysia crispata TaxID=231223 RepID=A0AAE0Y1L7_9GAST|nr:hypothetical protein RRG08_060066 [Elysia crispata]